MSDYWEDRQFYSYYAYVRGWLDALSPNTSLLDVGSADTPVPTWGQFEQRTSIDNRVQHPLDGVRFLRKDFMDVVESARVVTCLQVLEHVENPTHFANNLIASARQALIVSVPYKWDSDRAKDHLHDPIDEDKFDSWFLGVEPHARAVIAENKRTARMVTVYKF